MNSYQLLSELYKLLGVLDQKTVHEAQRLAHSPQLEPILRGLAEATGHRPSDAHRNGARPTRKRSEPRTSTSKDDRRVQEFTEVIHGFNDSPVAEFVELLKKHGLSVAFRKGEARSRVIKRASRAFAELSPEGQQRLLDKMRGGADSETAGWFEVIRNG